MLYFNAILFSLCYIIIIMIIIIIIIIIIMQRKISKAECCLSWDKVFIFERLSWLYWDLTLNKPDPTWPGRDEKCPGFI